MREQKSLPFHSDIASPDNGGNLRWSLLGIPSMEIISMKFICSIQSSKATSILPSRKFSPATFSLFIRIVRTPPRQCFLSVIVILNCNTIFFFVNKIFLLTFYYIIFTNTNIRYFCFTYFRRWYILCLKETKERGSAKWKS